MYFGDAFTALASGKYAAPAVIAPAATGAAVNTAAIERTLAETAAGLSAGGAFAITPSRLDHESRGTKRLSERAEEDAEAAGIPADANAPETAQTPASEPDVPETDSPHGPDWGTIVHRVFELAVLHGRFDEAALAAFARQAAAETLPDAPLTAAQRKLLLLPPETSREETVEKLAGMAASAAAFLTDDTSPLRQLMAGGDCCPELPFLLRETDRGSALYGHLASHISSPAAQNRDFDVQGVIDLAIHGTDGWTVVDYKTDILRKGETRDAFRARLRAEYTAQIAAYAQVLSRMDRGPTKRACLCAVALGGELVELTLN